MRGFGTEGGLLFIVRHEKKNRKLKERKSVGGQFLFVKGKRKQKRQSQEKLLLLQRECRECRERREEEEKSKEKVYRKRAERSDVREREKQKK